MDSGELLLLENQFISYHNSGLRWDDIKQRLPNVPEQLLQEWKRNLESVKTSAQSGRPREISVIPVGKDMDGNYIYQHKLNFQMPAHEMLRFSLWQASSIGRGESFNNAPPEKQQILRELSDLASQHLKVVEKHLAGFNFKRKFDEAGKFTYETTFETKNNPSPEEIENLRKAINFYIEKIEMPSYLGKNPKIRFQNLITPSPTFGKADIKMPVAIKQFYVSNFRGIKELHFTEIPVQSKWIFVTGENGFGKTSLLQAILLALNGRTDNGQVLFELNDSTENTFIGIEYLEGDKNIVRSVWDDEVPPMRKLISYGPSRLLIQTVVVPT